MNSKLLYYIFIYILYILLPQCSLAVYQYHRCRCWGRGCSDPARHRSLNKNYCYFVLKPRKSYIVLYNVITTVQSCFCIYSGIVQMCSPCPGTLSRRAGTISTPLYSFSVPKTNEIEAKYSIIHLMKVFKSYKT